MGSHATDCYLQSDYFNKDSFRSDSPFFLRAAFSSLKLDGLVYVTSTDEYSSGGHRSLHSLVAYEAYVRPMPYANELGVRILIGGAVRESSVLGYAVSWGELGQIRCPCSNTKDAASLVVSGPLWTGPLHSVAYIMEMLNLAEQWRWVGNGAGTDLEKLLKRILEESDPRLPFGYIKWDEVASLAQTNTPSVRTIMNTVHKEYENVCLVAQNQQSDECFWCRRDMLQVDHILPPMQSRRTVSWQDESGLPKNYMGAENFKFLRY
ncbi:hypothetical protein CRYUN_Cryun05aG0127700 [Craigia yunnanensis]